MKKSFTKDEIKAIYSAVVSGEGKTRYEKAVTIEAAVLSGYKGLFSNFGYGYYYEDETGEPLNSVVVPIALNAIFGDKPAKDENALLITINRERPNGIEGYNEPVLTIEDFRSEGYGELVEITLAKFAELLDGKEFNEDNAKLIFAELLVAANL